jgi:hypothetical protein
VLLDIGSVLGGIALAVVGFLVVVVVCVVILRLLAALLPSYEDRAPRASSAQEDPEAQGRSTTDSPAEAAPIDPAEGAGPVA